MGLKFGVFFVGWDRLERAWEMRRDEEDRGFRSFIGLLSLSETFSGSLNRLSNQVIL